jgi:hypothetical protein
MHTHASRPVCHSRARSIVTAFALVLLTACPLAAQQTSVAHDGEFLEIMHTYTLGDDGSITYNYAHRLRLLTSFGFTRQYGESFVIYDPARQTLKIDSSRTRMAGGTIVESPFNAYNEVLPSFAHNAAPWSGMREMVVTHTGLERGAVVHYGYTLTTRSGMYPGLSARVLLGDRSPVHRAVVRVRVPKSMTLAHVLMGHASTAPVRTEDGRMAVYTWTLENIPALAVESHQPPMDMVLPVLFFSTTGMRDIVEHALGGSGAMDLTAEAARVVDGITAKAGSANEKVRALQAHVATTIGSMPADLQFIGFRARPAMQTFASNVGSSLDRAVLLAAMLQHAKYSARPVLVSPYLTQSGGAWHAGSLDPALACAHLYTSAGVEVIVDGRPLLLDPFEAQAGSIATRFTRGAYLPLDAGTIATRALPLPGEALSRRAEITSDWTLAADLTLSGKSRVTVTGQAAPDLDPASLFGRNRPALVPPSYGLTFTKGETTGQRDASIACEVNLTPVRLHVHGGMLTVPVPHPVGGATESQMILPASSRSTPVLMGRQEELVRMTLHLPAGVRAEAAAQIELRNSVGDVRSVVRTDGASVEVERSISITTPIVRAEQYVDLHALIVAWKHRAHVQISLRQAGS